MTGYDGLRGESLRSACVNRGLPYHSIRKQGGVAAVREAIEAYDIEHVPQLKIRVPSDMCPDDLYNVISDGIDNDETGLMPGVWMSIEAGGDEIEMTFTGPSPAPEGWDWDGVLDPYACIRWIVMHHVDYVRGIDPPLLRFREIATHEAGHCIVAMATGETYQYEMVVRREGSGYCKTKGADAPSVHLAGAVAQLLAEGVEPTLEALQADRRWHPLHSWGSDIRALRGTSTADLEAAVAFATSTLREQWGEVTRVVSMVCDEFAAHPEAEAVELWHSDMRGMDLPEGWPYPGITTRCYPTSVFDDE